jgi:trehalose synthase
MPKLKILQRVNIRRTIKSSDFLKFMVPAQRLELLRLAVNLQGKKIVHINSTAIGGGVAELLQSLVPYSRALGVKIDWYVIKPSVGSRFFKITNKLHNALQGAAIKISQAEWAEYERVSHLVAQDLDQINCDVLVVNDPQPLLGGYYAKNCRTKIYYSHIDTSTVFEPVWQKLFPFITAYQKIIFSNRDFIHAGLLTHKVKVFTPAIDPLAPKQKIISRHQARLYLKQQGGIPTNCPLVVQVSRFDIWKNPLGLIQAFRLVKKVYPHAKLALVGFKEARDNVFSSLVYRQIVKATCKESDIFLFFEPRGKNILNFTVRAQNGADVIVQNSLKEGFGLVVAEAMWKYQPVVGGSATGLRRQIKNNQTGFITKTPEDLSKKIIFLLSHPRDKKAMGQAAHQIVVEKFLFPRLVLDHFRVYISSFKNIIK